MQHWLRLPPRLVVIENVLGKTASVENSKMRTDAGPGVRRRFAAIIEAGPVEGARQERALGEDFPPAFGRGRVAGMIHVVSADVASLFVVRINTPREVFAS